jgi:Na+-driven multidrug efflux pump
MQLMYWHLIQESAKVFGVLIFCFIAISTTYVFGTLLTANGNLKQLNIVAAGGMLLNIGLNLMLIPRMGALGSAWASLVTQSVMAILQIILAAVFFRFRFNPVYALRLFLFCSGVIVINFIMKQLPLYWIKSFLLTIAFSLSLATVLSLLDVRNFIRLFTGRFKGA